MDVGGFRGGVAHLIKGNPLIAEDDNFRLRFPAEEEAERYLADPFPEVLITPREIPVYLVIWAITRQVAGITRWTRRRSLEDLSPSTRKNYLASKAAKEEAKLNNVSSVQEWFRVAPDIKAFRRKAKPRKFAQYWYYVYIARDYGEAIVTSPEDLEAAEKAVAEMKRGRNVVIEPDRQMSFDLY